MKSCPIIASANPQGVTAPQETFTCMETECAWWINNPDYQGCCMSAQALACIQQAVVSRMRIPSSAWKRDEEHRRKQQS